MHFRTFLEVSEEFSGDLRNFAGIQMILSGVSMRSPFHGVLGVGGGGVYSQSTKRG